MGDRLQVGKPFPYVARHPGQLSLAVDMRNEYQRKLGRKQAHRTMHKPRIGGLAV